MDGTPIQYKIIEPELIAFTKIHVDTRDQILPVLEQVHKVCDGAIHGHPMVIFHGGAVKEGFLLEAAFPVESPIEEDGIQTRVLEAAPALTMIHQGPHQSIRETVKKIYDYLEQHAWTTSLFRREIYQTIDGDHPENNVTEVQVILHEWDRLLGEGAEKVLGKSAREEIMQGAESINPASTFTEYTAWIEGAMRRLDALPVSEEQKCKVVSTCAHVFPQERIEYLRGIFEQGGVDSVLREMYTDNFWYEKPVRRGFILYMRKNPFDPEGYEKAYTPAARRKAYCHCPFVHPYLEELPSSLSPTFCYCGAGWYRRLWEGILGQPVVIQHVETLLKGNDQCTLTITLPFTMEGECVP